MNYTGSADQENSRRRRHTIRFVRRIETTQTRTARYDDRCRIVRGQNKLQQQTDGSYLRATVVGGHQHDSGSAGSLGHAVRSGQLAGRPDVHRTKRRRTDDVPARRRSRGGGASRSCMCNSNNNNNYINNTVVVVVW